jgi:methyl-accepting chemotaxis protein
MGNGRRFSLRGIFTTLVTVLLVLFGAAMAWVTTASLEAAIQAQLEARARSLANLLARNVDTKVAYDTTPDLSDDLASVAEETEVVFVAVTAEGGKVLGRQAAEAWRTSLDRALSQGQEGDVGELFIATAPIVVERPVRTSGGMDDLDFQLGGAPAAPAATEEVTLGRAVVGLSKAGMVAAVRAARAWVLIATAIFVAGAAVFAFFFTRWVTRPLSRMVELAVAMSHGDYQAVGTVRSRAREVGELADAFAVMRESLAMVADQARSIAAGDLSRRVSGAGHLGEAFNAMVQSLSRLVGQIQKASIQIASSSAEILAASKQAERGSAEQASSISQTTTTMDELLSASKQIATSADAVVRIAEQTLGAAKAGEDAVQQGISGMEEIAENNRQTAERILELSERNQQIGNIVDLIDEIADKSDLLALNAAIEGAKAGEAGKGFAVVATEMRALAENVVDSTKEIKSLISEIQKASNSSVLATEGQMKATERGTQVALRTGEQLEKILQMVEQTTEAAKQISLATQQQRTGTEQVVQSMSEIAKIAKSNVAGAGQTTSSTVELSNLAEELKKAVSQFRLGPEAR